MRKFIIVISAFFVVHCIQAQSYASWQLDRDTASIGDPIKAVLNIRIEGSEDYILDFSEMMNIPNEMYKQDTVNFTSIADIEILDGGEMKLSGKLSRISTANLNMQNVNGGREYRDSVKVAMYDVGMFYIPGPEAVSGDQNWMDAEDPLIIVQLPEEIQKALQDTVEIAPIKPIIEEPMTLEDFKYGFLILGLILAFSMLFYYLRKRRKDEVQKTEIPEVVLPAHIIALEKLDKLQASELWQKGQVKEYQSKLTFIIREYLENRYHINALEMTSDEILRAIPDEVPADKLRQVLQIADMVKFAKANPPVDIHSRFMDDAYEIVRTTKQENFSEDA